MLPGDVKQTTSKCSRRSQSPPELSNFSPLIGFWSDSFDSSSEYGSSRKALKIFTGGRNVSSEIFCVVLPETNGCLTKCRLDLQPPWLGPPPPPHHPHPGRSHSHPHQKTKSINSTPSPPLLRLSVYEHVVGLFTHGLSRLCETDSIIIASFWGLLTVCLPPNGPFSASLICPV